MPSRSRRTSGASRKPLAEQPWVLELVKECKGWASIEQFGTMLTAIRTAATEHGVDLVELQKAVARRALAEGIVRPLPVYETVEALVSGAPLAD